MSEQVTETMEQKLERYKAERAKLAAALVQINLVLKANASRFREGINDDDLHLAEVVYFGDDEN